MRSRCSWCRAWGTVRVDRARMCSTRSRRSISGSSLAPRRSRSWRRTWRVRPWIEPGRCVRIPRPRIIAAPAAPMTRGTSAARRPDRRVPSPVARRERSGGLPVLAWRTMHRLAAVALAAVCLAAPAIVAQNTPAAAPAVKAAVSVKPWPEDEVLLARRTEAQNRKLFQNGAPLEFTLTSDFNRINGERTPNTAAQYAGVLTVDGAEIPVTLGSRGHLRLKSQTCEFVP